MVRFFIIHGEHFRGEAARPDLIPFKFPAPRHLKELAFDLVARRRVSPGDRRPLENFRRLTFVCHASIRFVFRAGQALPRGKIIKHRRWRLIFLKFSGSENLKIHTHTHTHVRTLVIHRFRDQRGRHFCCSFVV